MATGIILEQSDVAAIFGGIKVYGYDLATKNNL